MNASRELGQAHRILRDAIGESRLEAVVALLQLNGLGLPPSRSTWHRLVAAHSGSLFAEMDAESIKRIQVAGELSNAVVFRERLRTGDCDL